MFLNKFNGILRRGVSGTLRRTINTTSWNRGYEGDGKTVATDLQEQIGKYIVVKSFNEYGFYLTNSAFALGSLILFPNVFLSVSFSFLPFSNESLNFFPHSGKSKQSTTLPKNRWRFSKLSNRNLIFLFSVSARPNATPYISYVNSKLNFKILV